jgi:thiol-disulfide isomerase/thioredoxin
MRFGTLCMLAMAVLQGQNIKTGPAVGNKVPDFSAQDQEGRRQTLKTVSGPKGTMLVFFRSADWCPFCKTQLVELQRNLDAIRQQGQGLRAVFEMVSVHTDRAQGVVFGYGGEDLRSGLLPEAAAGGNRSQVGFHALGNGFGESHSDGRLRQLQGI